MNCELKKLELLLKKNGVPFSLVCRRRFFLCYPSEQFPVCVVLPATTGLSMHGLFSPEEKNGQMCTENISAQEAAKRILRHFFATKKKRNYPTTC